MFSRLRLPSPALVVACVALLVSLGGTAVAAGVVPLAKRALVADNARKLQGRTPTQVMNQATQVATRQATQVATQQATEAASKAATDAATQTAGQALSQAANTPGPASTAAGLVSVKTGAWSLQPGAFADVTVTCDAGQKAIAGGYEDPEGWAHSYDSRPAGDGTGWATYVTVSKSAPGAQTGTLYAVCIK